MREELRAAVIGTKGRSKIVDVGGKQYRVYEPSVGARQAFLMLLNLNGPDDKITGNVAKAQIKLVILCTYDPDTNERIFEAEDEELLMNSPADGPIKILSEAALSFSVEASDVGKNSGATASAS